MAKMYWSVFVVQANSEEEARRLHEKQRAIGEEHVVDAEFRSCFAGHEPPVGATSDMGDLFSVKSDEPELSQAANYAIELLDDEND